MITANINREIIKSPEEATTAKAVDSLVIKGDISAMTPEQQREYYLLICEHLGLNAATQPFSILTLQGKKILYPTRQCTDQLAAMYRLNREIVEGPEVRDVGGTKIVYCKCLATHPNGRVETSISTLPLTDPLNVLMKSETKAKRRATLSILGLGSLAEFEPDNEPTENVIEQLPNNPALEDIANPEQTIQLRTPEWCIAEYAHVYLDQEYAGNPTTNQPLDVEDLKALFESTYQMVLKRSGRTQEEISKARFQRGIVFARARNAFADFEEDGTQPQAVLEAYAMFMQKFQVAQKWPAVDQMEFRQAFLDQYMKMSGITDSQLAAQHLYDAAEKRLQEAQKPAKEKKAQAKRDAFPLTADGWKGHLAKKDSVYAVGASLYRWRLSWEAIHRFNEAQSIALERMIAIEPMSEAQAKDALGAILHTEAKKDTEKHG